MTRLSRSDSTAEELLLDRAADCTTSVDGLVKLVSAYLYLVTDGKMKYPAGKETGLFLKAS